MRINNVTNYEFASWGQVILHFFAILLTLILFASGVVQFGYSIISFFEKNDLICFINNILYSFELFFMAPIPFLIIFAHKNNIKRAFPNLINKENGLPIDPIDERIAKKTFISSIIGILITSILKFFIDILHDYKEFEISWQFFAIIVSIFLFLIILIFYFKLLSTKYDNENIT
jgi:hypothetical protein